ncbi:MAG: Ig-like domain-containing protein [Bryobacteraceae bacterium]
MNKIRILVYAALGSVLCAAALEAQTPAAVNVISGNGQLDCQSCIKDTFISFDPIAVQVVDAVGRPVAGTPVNWAVASGTAYFTPPNDFGATSITTITDNTGTTSVPIGQLEVLESGGAQFGVSSTITATAGSASATFFETQASEVNPGPGTIDVVVNYPNDPNGPQYTPITGTAGSAGPSFNVGVYTVTLTGIPNIALFLANYDNTVSPPVYTIGPSANVPSAYCETQAGAGLYTVLSSSSGIATCNVKFGPVAGSGTYVVVTGGSVPTTVGAIPDSNFITGSWDLTVTAPKVGSVTVVSGNNQAALAGAALQPLVAEVLDTSSNPLLGQGVTWAATPANAIQLNNVTTSSDTNGIVEVTNPVLSTSAAGTITVTATSNTNSKAVATFTIAASQPITVSSLTIQSGNNQTAVEGAAFTNPLAVTVIGSNGAPIAGTTVSFTASGPVTLSASSTTTSSSGVAQVTATGGATPGTATVTASIGGLSQIFNLTVVPPGPNLAVSSFVNGADGQVGSISPCSVAAIVGAGVAAGGAALAPVVGPLQYDLATDTVNFGTSQAPMLAPIFAVSNVTGQQQILIQVPCEVTPGTVPVTVTVNGGSQTLNVKVLPASPGIYQTLMSDGVVRAVIERPDGSFVSPSNPARRGETVTAFVTGLGPASPSIGTNGLPIPGTPSTVNGQVIVGIQNEGVPVTEAQLAFDMVGVYLIQFEIPSDAPQGDNIVFSVGLIPVGSSQAYYSNSTGSKIPIE